MVRQTRKKATVVPHTPVSDKSKVALEFWRRRFPVPCRRIDGTDYLDGSYRLRYEVYCHEVGFLDARDYPDGRERDAYDADAIHFGAIRDDDQVVGTVRLVPWSGRGFPMLDHCPVDIPEAQKPHAVEVSRLAVSRMFRRREGDGLYGMAQDRAKLDEIPRQKGDPRRKPRPEVVVGLYKAMYHESKRLGITHWYAAMEPLLARLLARFNFVFRPIGPEVDYYGPVQPYMAAIDEIEKHVFRSSPIMFWAFCDGLESEFLPRWARDFLADNERPTLHS